MRVLIWLTRACGFIFALALVSLAIGIADNLFSLDLFDGKYPVIGGDGDSTLGSFGTFLWQTGGAVVVFGVVGGLLYAVTGDAIEEQDARRDAEEAAARAAEPELSPWAEATAERKAVASSDESCPVCGQLFLTADEAQAHVERFHR